MVKAIGLLLCLLLAACFVVFAAIPPNLTKALEIQYQLVAAHPRDPGVYNDLGNLHLEAGDVEAAEAAYRRALELEPTRTPPRFNLGLLLQSQRRTDEAFAEFTIVLEQDPSNAWAHYQFGTLLAHRGQRQAAVEAYARAVSLDPNLAFPDVNPHVIDNELFTESLLLAYRGQGYALFAPRTYEEPSRIRAILVPSEAAPEGEEGAQDEEGEGEEGEGETRAGAAGGGIGAGGQVGTGGSTRVPASAETRERTGSSRSLSADDLRPSRGVNQATEPSTRQPVRGGVRRGSPRSQPSVRTPPRVPGRVQPPNPNPPARFRAGPSSTGRLDLKLFSPDSQPAG